MAAFYSFFVLAMCQSFCYSVQVTQLELDEIGQKVWRLRKEVSGITIHEQGLFEDGDRASKEDRAPVRLFDPILPKQLDDCSRSFSLMAPLFDKYIRDVDEKETFTAEKNKEIHGLVKFISDTDVMKAVRRFLKSRSFIESTDSASFSNELLSLWFGNYSRNNGAVGSSGFEHVFLGQIMNSEVIGGHNWYRFYLAERKGEMNYLGYYENKLIGKEMRALTLKYTWDGFLKPKGSLLIGATPEFEMALYMLCFYVRPNNTCTVEMNPTTFVVIKSRQTVGVGGRVYLATAYVV